ALYAQACCPPAATFVARRCPPCPSTTSPARQSYVPASIGSPRPSCPRSAFPQHATSDVARRAQAKSAPVARSTARTTVPSPNATTLNGAFDPPLGSTPTSPVVVLPQHTMRPSPARAHGVSVISAICTIGD